MDLIQRHIWKTTEAESDAEFYGHDFLGDVAYNVNIDCDVKREKHSYSLDISGPGDHNNVQTLD